MLLTLVFIVGLASGLAVPLPNECCDLPQQNPGVKTLNAVFDAALGSSQTGSQQARDGTAVKRDVGGGDAAVKNINADLSEALPLSNLHHNHDTDLFVGDDAVPARND